MKTTESAAHHTHDGNGVDGGYGPDVRFLLTPPGVYGWCLWFAITTIATTLALIDTTISTTTKEQARSITTNDTSSQRV